MKKIFLSTAFIIAATVAVWAQAPQQFNYQGIARDGQGAPLISQPIHLRLTIHDGSPTGAAVYTETQLSSTNAYGLYTVQIGSVTPITGVNWATGSKFIQVEMDPTGGTNYTTIGTPQLLSVPYALYAAQAPVPPPPASDVNGTPNRLIKFGTATTGVNSRIVDSVGGLFYNSTTLLDPTNCIGDMKLLDNSLQGSEWMSLEGSGQLGYTFLTISDSTTGNKGLLIGQSQNVASSFFNGDVNNLALVVSPSSSFAYFTNSSSTIMDMDLNALSTDFYGDVNVLGNLTKGGGTFKIDDPTDPANKYLYHSFVESPDMMNMYNGNVTTDANGVAVVTLPDYFDALNKDFRYQLTVIGTFAQAIVGEKVVNNHFTIKTNQPNVEVSWQVTGVRKDAWANAHRVVPEVAKEAKDKGKYLYPKEMGQPTSLQINNGSASLSKKK